MAAELIMSTRQLVLLTNSTGYGMSTITYSLPHVAYIFHSLVCVLCRDTFLIKADVC